MRDAAYKAQVYRLTRQHAQRPVIVAIGDRAARNGDQIGGLGSGKGLAVALLSFVLEDRLQPTFRIPLADPHDGIAADIEGFA